MAIDHPVGADGREYDLVGVRLYWQYQLDVPQQRYSDVRAVMQESLKGSLDIPRDMFLLPDWPTFTRPDGGLPTMHYADTHGNTILDLELLGSFCAKAEGVELETVTIRPDRLTGTVVYDCNFTTDNPEGLLPVGAFALNELTLNGNPLHRFNRFVRAKPVAAYGVLTIQVAPGPTPPAWADVTSHSFPLPSGSLSLFNTLHANFDVPLDPGTDLTGEYPTHFVRMSLALTHDLEIPYNKHVLQGYGLPSRRLAFRTVPQSSNTTINSCDLRTSLVSNTFTPPQPPPPAPPIPDVTQTSVRCWAEYEQTTVVTPARWELLTDPGLAAPLIQASTIISNSRFITPNPFVIATDFHVPSLARINDEILNYPDTNDITTPRPASLDRPPYTSPVISRPDPNPVALQVGERAIVSLSIMGMDPTANYDITVTYPTVVATDARCSSRTLTDTVTTGSPDNVGAYALNIAVHACPTPGTGTATANINVSLVESAITRAQLDIPISVQRYSTPTIDLNVSNTNVSYGDATDISVEVRGLNPAREYAVFVTLPSGLRFNPGCTGSFSTTLPIRRYTITHYDSVRAYGCAAGTGSVNAALRLVIPSGANPGSDAHSAASLAEQLLIRYDPAQNNQVYFDAD